MGLAERTAKRALAELEAAKLVTAHRIPGHGVEVTILVTAPRGGRDRFLKGPIPWDWLEIAARLPGKALHVGLALWLEAGMSCCLTVKVGVSRVGFGVNEQAARRGLRVLEKAGLIEIHRRPGQLLEVRLREPGRGNEGKGTYPRV
jgi:hypothetical protein